MGGPVRMQPFEPQEGLLEKAGRALSLKNVIQGQQLGAQRLQEGRMSLDERRQAMQQQMQISEAIAKAGSLEAALPEIEKFAPEYAMERKQKIVAYKNASLDEKKKMNDLELAQMARYGQYLAGANDQASWEQAIQAAEDDGLPKGAAAFVRATPYSPENQKRVQKMLVGQVEAVKAVNADLDGQIKAQTVRKATAEAGVAEEEAKLTPEHKAALKGAENALRIAAAKGDPDAQAALAGLEKFQQKMAAIRRGPREGSGVDRRSREQELIELAADQYLAEAGEDANQALVNLEKELAAGDVSSELLAHAARIRQRIRERVRPGVPGGRGDRLGEILEGKKTGRQ